MKKIFLTTILCFSLNLFCADEPTIINHNDKDLELLQEALEIVGSMSDNIANLIIQNKTNTSSPEMTKKEALALIEKITDFVIVVLKKSRHKKSSKQIPLHSQEDLQIMIDHLADEIIRKSIQ